MPVFCLPELQTGYRCGKVLQNLQKNRGAKINKTNSDQLKRIMREKGLSPADVAQIMNCSIWTVYRWRSDCDMPAHRLELLQLKLAMRAVPGVEAAHV